MHWRLVSIVVSLLCEVIRMGSGVVQRHSAQRETSDDCRSCLECSRDNGCVRCPERFFLFLQRDGMSHHGTCLLTCPAGHYEQKGKDMNRCMKCRSMDCDHCFSRDFCTKCKAGFQLYKGKCLSRCPLGTFPHHTDCLEHCLPAPLGEWSEWSICQRDGATCGYRWGKQTRTRGSGYFRGTSDNQTTSYCPIQTETQRCRMRKICTPARKEHCLLAPLGEWSEWSVCQRDGATCGYRWGKQTRTRGSGYFRGTSDNQTTSYCPIQTETQRCRMKCTPAIKEGGKKRKGLGLKRERKRLRMLSANETTTGGSSLRRQ